MPFRDAEPRSTFLLSGTFLLSCLSIAFFKLTSWFSSSGIFTTSSAQYGFDEVFVQIFAMVLLLAIERFCSYTSRQASAVLVVAASLQAVGSFLLFSPAYGNEQSALVALILRGVGSSVFLLAFGRLLCSIEPIKSALVIAGGEVLVGVFPVIFSSVPADAVAFVSSALPLAAAFCLLWAIEKTATAESGSSPVTREQLKKIPIHPIILLILCALSTIGIALVGQTPQANVDLLYRLLTIAVNLVVFSAYLIWIYGLKRNDPDTLWPFLMVIIFVGLFVFSSFSSIAPDAASSLLSATRKTLMVFAWVFMASIIYQLKLPAIPFFCLGQLAISQIPHTIAFFIRQYDLQISSNYQETSATILMAIMALAVIAGVLVVVYKSRLAASANQHPASPEAALKAAIDRLSDQYSLSSREAEVALLLAKGDTLGATAENLTVSLDTVRTHAKNLYRKLDIHKRQELLSLVQGELDLNACNAPIGGRR